jgi:Tfp pilus assembly protein, tip-associated adhesin PilY1
MFATTAAAIVPTPVQKDYFFDGPTGVYQNGATAYIYLAARRGGGVIYALDVSDPAVPKLLWKKTNATSTAFRELGQTWSQPTVTRVRGVANPVLIFGAGYDAPNEDNEPPTTDTMGRGIFILDAVTGDLLWQAGPGGSTNTCTVTAAAAATTGCQLQKMTYAIPGDITLVDRDFDGCIDRLYAADTGGNIWRVDLEAKVAATSGTCGDNTALTGAQPKDWQATLFAKLGGANSDATRRKFFFSPDVVVTKNFDAVLATTGDREHPLRTVAGSTATNAYAIYNKFYMIKDTITGKDASTWTAVEDTTSSTANLVESASFFDATSAKYDGTLKGFAIKLGNTGEKGVNAPATVGGFTFFGTNQPIVPPTNSCDPNLGTARGYRVNFLTGEAKNVVFDGGGLPPSPVTGLVEVTISGEQRVVPFIIGGGNPDTTCKGPDCVSALGGGKPDIPIKGIRHRTHWYQERDK